MQKMCSISSLDAALLCSRKISSISSRRRTLECRRASTFGSSTLPRYGAISFRYSAAIAHAPLLRPQVGELLADGHEIARPAQRVARHVVEHVLLFMGERVQHRGVAE